MLFKKRLPILTFFKKWLRHEENMSLVSDLLAHANPKADLSERVLWTENILRWLQAKNANPNVRVDYLMNVLNKNPLWKENVTALLRSVLRDCSFFRLLTQTGMASESGLMTELFERLVMRIFPQVPEHDFFEIFESAFHNETQGISFLQTLSAESFAGLVGLIALDDKHDDPWKHLRQATHEALIVLSANVTHYGLSNSIRQRHPVFAIQDSSFLNLQLMICEWLGNEDGASQLEIKTKIDERLGHCRQTIQAVRDNLEVQGVSVGIVYRLEILLLSLDRIDELMEILVENKIQSKIPIIQQLGTKLVMAVTEKKSIRKHLRSHLELLSRKIAERNGNSGEHYIARTSKETWNLIGSAMKGGVIVVFITGGKIFLHRAELPPLIFALGAWLVYTSGFLGMQWTRSTLATKLPSYTASHLARRLREIKNRDATDEFTFELLVALKSQALALIGNILGVLPLVFAFAFVLTEFFDATLLSPVEAKSMLADLHPYLSWTLPLAVLTGAELWLSSLAGGWFENWIVFRKIPQAIERHAKLNRLIGPQRSQRWGKALLNQASAFGGNVTLGFLFAFVPFFGTVLGFSLDGRHVTISTTGALMSFASLSPKLWWGENLLTLTVVSLILTGLLNFFVSFYLALWVAARACNVKSVWLKYAMGASLRRLLGQRRRS